MSKHKVNLLIIVNSVTLLFLILYIFLISTISFASETEKHISFFKLFVIIFYSINLFYIVKFRNSTKEEISKTTVRCFRYLLLFLNTPTFLLFLTMSFLDSSIATSHGSFSFFELFASIYLMLLHGASILFLMRHIKSRFMSFLKSCKYVLYFLFLILQLWNFKSSSYFHCGGTYRDFVHERSVYSRYLRSYYKTCNSFPKEVSELNNNNILEYSYGMTNNTSQAELPPIKCSKSVEKENNFKFKKDNLVFDYSFRKNHFRLELYKDNLKNKFKYLRYSRTLEYKSGRIKESKK